MLGGGGSSGTPGGGGGVGRIRINTTLGEVDVLDGGVLSPELGTSAATIGNLSSG